VPRLRVTQVRGLAGKPKRQRDTVRALGLRRIRHAVVKEDRPEIRGMIARVRHLVDVEEVDE
jgi:large subunit ribosomal protein L30